MFEQLLDEISSLDCDAATLFKRFEQANVERLAWAYAQYAWPERRPKFAADAVKSCGISTAKGFEGLCRAIAALDHKLLDAKLTSGLMDEVRLVRRRITTLQSDPEPTGVQQLALVDAALDLVQLCPEVYREGLRTEYRAIAGDFRGSYLLEDDEWRPHFVQALLTASAGYKYLAGECVTVPQLRTLYSAINSDIRECPEPWQLLSTLSNKIQEGDVGPCEALRGDRQYTVCLWSMALFATAPGVHGGDVAQDILQKIKVDAYDFRRYPYSNPRVAKKLEEARAILPLLPDVLAAGMVINELLSETSAHRGRTALALCSTAVAVMPTTVGERLQPNNSQEGGGKGRRDITEGALEPKLDDGYFDAMRPRLSLLIREACPQQEQENWRATLLGNSFVQWAAAREDPGKLHKGERSILDTGPASRKLGTSLETSVDGALNAAPALHPRAKQLTRALITVVIAPTRKNGSEITLDRFTDAPPLKSLQMAIKTLMGVSPLVRQVVCPLLDAARSLQQPSAFWSLSPQKMNAGNASWN